MKISIYIIGTNNYFPLALRFIRKFDKFYTGEYQIEYLLFTDQKNVFDFLPTDTTIDIKLFHTEHENWRQGTNSKFKNIIDNIDKIDSDYIFYFDADTSVEKPFNEQWFLGNIVGGQHFNNLTHTIPSFERRKESKAYIPLDTDRPQIYYYGAFFGGKKDEVFIMCKKLYEFQYQDSLINLEPIWNDESYINHYFHYNSHKMILSKDFEFLVSHKGGLETRNTKVDNSILEKIKACKNLDWDIINGEICSTP